ncbi:MAG: hypothetical protein MUO26_08075 [Methanotrichaceae archaeon]|nr:hypothetical protein [Methanotrichaceae archaeon]
MSVLYRIVLLYSPEIDPFLEDLAKIADYMFYFEEDPPRLSARISLAACNSNILGLTISQWILKPLRLDLIMRTPPR